MTYREKRCLFSMFLSKLIDYIINYGDENTKYEVAIHDVCARDGHKKNSFHYECLAGDLHLYINGIYQRTTKAHEPFGRYWKSLHPMCTWGGDFKRKDENHYSFGEGKRC